MSDLPAGALPVVAGACEHRGMEILAVGSVAAVAKGLVGSLFSVGFGAFLVAFLVDQLRTPASRAGCCCCRRSCSAAAATSC